MQLTTEYFYDELNQLIRENDPVANKTITYTYDEGGNILQKNEYEYTTSDTLGSSGFVIFYAYDSEWKDLLTSYGGLSITYDEIGNPLTFDDTTLTWERGRKLSTMTFADGSTTSYKYNADGIRTQKTVNGVTTDYFLEGSTIVAQKTGNDVIWYYFDGDGTRDAIEYGGKVYYYMYNPQGDVIGLFDDDLNVVVEYTYDSWGKVKTTGTLKDTLGKANPFRYRGYYYDEESGFYYLNSRYYYPEICRFINADDIDIIGVQGDLYDKNLFAYCDNNPTCRIDVGGYAWETALDVITLATSVADVIANPANMWAWAGLIGDVVDVAIPFVGGIGETVKLCGTINKVDNVIDAAKNVKKSVSKSVGTYEIVYKSGKNYVGKGPFSRAIKSAERYTNPHKLNKFMGDEVVSITWKKAGNSNKAFLTEYMWQHRGSGVLSANRQANTYNQIWSPGRSSLKWWN